MSISLGELVKMPVVRSSLCDCASKPIWTTIILPALLQGSQNRHEGHEHQQQGIDVQPTNSNNQIHTQTNYGRNYLWCVPMTPNMTSKTAQKRLVITTQGLYHALSVSKGITHQLTCSEIFGCKHAKSWSKMHDLAKTISDLNVVPYCGKTTSLYKSPYKVCLHCCLCMHPAPSTFMCYAAQANRGLPPAS